MAWIESHQELARHPKTRRLARVLGVSIPAAIGHLHLLWWWCLDYAQDGDVTDVMEDLAEAALWEGDADAFWHALTESGFIDVGERATIHDWQEYAGRLVEKRKANAERMRIARAAHVSTPSGERATHVQRTSHARAGATVPNRTVQNSTEPETTPTAATQPTVAAAPPAQDEPEPNVAPLVSRAKAARTPKGPAAAGKGLAPLFDAFRIAGLARPNLTDPKEAKAAAVLLQLHKPSDVAGCWAAVETGRYGDGWLGENLSFVALANMNRVANFLRAERELAAARTNGRRLHRVDEADDLPPDPAEGAPLPAADPAAETLWTQAADVLRGRMSAPNHAAYIAHCQGLAFEGERLLVAVDNPLLLEGLERFRPLLRATLADLSGKPADIRLVAS